MLALAGIQPLKHESSSGLQSLADRVLKHREALSALEQPVEHWDAWFVLFAASGMDPTTRREWEKEVRSLDTPATYDQVITFLQASIGTLKSLESRRPASRPDQTRPKPSRDRARVTTVLSTTQTPELCQVCNGSHILAHCQDFRQMNLSQRSTVATKARLCYNCLRMGHSVRNCSSKGHCRQCEQKHHTLLHGASNQKRGLDSHSYGSAPKKPRSAMPLHISNPSCSENTEA